MPRGKTNTAATELRHDPLATQLRKDEVIVDAQEAARGGGGTTDDKPVRRKKRRVRRKEMANETSESFVEAKMASKLMAQAEAQRKEIEAEEGGRVRFPDDPLPAPKLFQYESDGEESAFSEDEEHYGGGGLQLEAGDERLMGMFMGGSATARVPGTRNLADIIEAKLREAEGAIMLNGMAQDLDDRIGASLPPKVVKAYRIVGRVMKQYRSGKLPKAFKIIPALENWEEIVFITDPASWSKQAMYQAVKVFASNLNSKMAQRFFNLVLLPCFREDVQDNKKLNFHLYQALKKALYKPAAFYKGFVLPLLEQGCSVREALIVSSVLARVSVPMLHSAAAMLRMIDMDYTGPLTIILNTLVDKKYALPLRVVDGLVQYFVTFRDYPNDMPLVWHRSLLTFAQRYRNDLEDYQLELLRQLLKHQQHEYLTPEIRRVLFNPGSVAHAGPSSAAESMSYTGPDLVSMDSLPVFTTPLTNPQ